jgi:hypothetical protein
MRADLANYRNSQYGRIRHIGGDGTTTRRPPSIPRSLYRSARLMD